MNYCDSIKRIRVNICVLICKRKDVTILHEILVCCCGCCSDLGVEARVCTFLCPPARYSNDV